jgi:hypothetical protein
MWRGAKFRASRDNLPFDITVDDLTIPEFCPVLGIKLDCSGSAEERDTAPSIDRIIPEEGYVKGNVCVISQKANRLKNNATIDELMAIVDYLLLNLGLRKENYN